MRPSYVSGVTSGETRSASRSMSTSVSISDSADAYRDEEVKVLRQVQALDPATAAAMQAAKELVEATSGLASAIHTDKLRLAGGREVAEYNAANAAVNRLEDDKAEMLRQMRGDFSGEKDPERRRLLEKVLLTTS